MFRPLQISSTDIVLFSYICLAIRNCFSSLKGDLGRPPFFPRARAATQSSIRPLPDNIPFKFRKRPENMEDQFPTAGGRIDAFRQTLKPNVSGVKVR